MRLAVVGSGVSGLVAAYLLSQEHYVALFERDGRLGGHAHTHQVQLGGRTWLLDSGFLVFNHRTYPNFVRLLRRLGVRSQATEMSHSVRCRRCRLEYSNRFPLGLFAQGRRLYEPRHLRMLLDWPRFAGHALRFLSRPPAGAGVTGVAGVAGVDAMGGHAGETSLGGFLDSGRYSDGFVRHCLLPFGGAVWSSPREDVRRFPARPFLQFMDNHGMLTLYNAPRWRTIVGGSKSYVDAIAGAVSGPISLGTPVCRITREAEGVTLHGEAGAQWQFDAVVIATHADQALRLLGDPSLEERAALGQFRYAHNRAVLHTDEAVLPAARGARASWNSDVADCAEEGSAVRVSYDLNRLQRLKRAPQFCVSLNQAGELQGETLAAMDYAHPIMDAAAFAGQPMVEALNGRRRTYYCGAHLRYGFHEDGVVSALRVAARFGISL